MVVVVASIPWPPASPSPESMPWSFSASASTDYVHRFELGRTGSSPSPVFFATATDVHRQMRRLPSAPNLLTTSKSSVVSTSIDPPPFSCRIRRHRTCTPPRRSSRSPLSLPTVWSSSRRPGRPRGTPWPRPASARRGRSRRRRRPFAPAVVLVAVAACKLLLLR